MVNNIQIYIYFDLTKPGKYVYEGFNFSLLYEPIYVGIGLKNRYKTHYSNAKHLLDKKYRYKSEKLRKRDMNHLKLITIRKLIEEHGFKLEQMCFILTNDLDREEAKRLEIEYVTKIGRQLDHKGPLLNYTLGGDGGLGKPWTEEQRKAKSEAMKGSNNPMFGKKGELCPSYGLIRSEETRKKCSDSVMGDKNVHKGKIPWNKDKHWDDKVKESISVANIKYIYECVNSNDESFIIDKNIIRFLEQNNLNADSILSLLNQNKETGHIINTNGWKISRKRK